VARPVPLKAQPPAATSVKGKTTADHIQAKVGGNFAGADGDFEVKFAQTDNRGLHHSRVVQKFRGVPVWGGEAVLHLKADGTLDEMTDNLYRNIGARVTSTTPGLSEAQATAAAERALSCQRCSLPGDRPELLLFPSGESIKLVYRVALDKVDGSRASARPMVMVDATTGAVVAQYNNLQTGTGVSNYYGTVTTGTSLHSGTHYLEDLTTKAGIFDARGGTTTLIRVSDADGAFTDAGHKSAVDAQFGMNNTLAYLKNTFGYIGLNGAGGPGYQTSATGNTQLMGTVVHFGAGYGNAFWDGARVVCGDGDGTTFSSLTSVDIVGHEMAHGVIEFTSGLIYSGESGALNESFADVIGSLVERQVFGESADTWKMGEKVYTPANGTADALRHLDNPHNAANNGFTTDDDPDHYSERYTGAADNGGVHVNSGIPNKAFYLLAKGGTHHKGGSMTGIGVNDAAAIWFKGFTQYMSAGTTFAGARAATLFAARALYGVTSPQYVAVGDAWALVGVGNALTPAPRPPGGPVVAVELLQNGNFEGTASPWFMSGNASYMFNGTAPHSGTGYAYSGTGNGGSGQFYQTVSIPAGVPTATLSYQLNVTSAEVSTTTAYDKLFVEVRSSTGALLNTLATYSNLNKGAVGAYALKTHDLSAYRGQTVRIQFRFTADAANQTTFRVDTVSLK